MATYQKLTTKMTLQISSTVETTTPANMSQMPQSSNTSSNDLFGQLQLMIHKECVREIDQACADLNISADPYNWSVIDVQKWLFWMRQQMPELSSYPIERFQMNGMSLCSMYKRDFLQHFPGQVGEKLFAKIELWRMAMNSIRPDTLLDSLFGEPETPANNYSQSSASYSPAYSSASPQQNYGSYSSASSNYGPSTPYQTSDYGSETFNSDDEMSDDGHAGMSPYSQTNYSRGASATNVFYSQAPAQGYAHQQAQQQHHQQQQPQQQQQYFNYSQQQQAGSQQYYCNAARSSSVSPSPMHSPSAASSCRSYSPTMDGYSHYDSPTSNMMASRPMAMPAIKQEFQEQQQSFSHSHHHHHHHASMYATPPTTPTSVSSTPLATPPQPATTSSSSHIHLWQFLKELLASPSQFGASIRWLDRSKGVFKIEDSVRVAKLWGARKNRPAMNYDKLSRSIRQYYKKGIMKKTERSQRLVYQFCPSYAA